ncbi:hypothetical protein B6S59_13815 [Pseudomonas sp. A46]|nr:DUF3613 domain-containing protein [Pseudomonas sp. A46]OWJ94426.1 hypothetical protein B6S59_13815 [Pseudomonas sp. A46]
MKTLIGLLLLAASLGLQADEDPRERQPERQRLSEQWLSTQREGIQASRHAQTATPTERELANQRWLESYKYAIPERYYGDGLEPGGSSSGN